jgi:hypothetical protein
MVMTSDKSGAGVAYFFIAVGIFVVVYFREEVWAILKAIYQIAIEPHLSR